MNKRMKWVSLITLSCLVLSTLLVLNPFGVQNASATFTEATVGGFLLPWAGDINLSQGPHWVNGPGASYAIDAPGTFDILAPKDGTIVDFKDDMYSLYNYRYDGCNVQHGGVNYLILGHGPKNGEQYDHYSVYFHLARHSVSDLGLNTTTNKRVKTGQIIGQTGNTGYVEPFPGGGN